MIVMLVAGIFFWLVIFGVKYMLGDSYVNTAAGMLILVSFILMLSMGFGCFAFLKYGLPLL